jgi:hypothetical protein
MTLAPLTRCSLRFDNSRRRGYRDKFSFVPRSPTSSRSRGSKTHERQSRKKNATHRQDPSPTLPLTRGGCPWAGGVSVANIF